MEGVQEQQSKCKEGYFHSKGNKQKKYASDLNDRNHQNEIF